MEYGKYHLTSDENLQRLSVLDQVIEHTVHLNLCIILDLGERWSLIFPKLVHIRFRWTLPRMRDRVTSKRLTASGYSLIYDSQYYCQIPTINMVCEENVTQALGLPIYRECED